MASPKQKRKKSKRKNQGRRRMRIICFCMTLILILLIAAAAGIAYWKMPIKTRPLKRNLTSSSTSSGSTEDSQPDAAQVSETEENSTDRTDEPEDTRAVKNTATQEQHKTNGLSICMYHYVYDQNDPPEEINNNFIEVHALEEELKYLVENNYFFPTWEEVRKYIDGELLLPEKSVVLTFDDGAKSFLNLGAPLFNKYKIPVTSFLITNQDGPAKVKKYASDYVTFQSHSDNMHRGGGNIGHGGIFPVLSYEEAVADLNKSTKICGNGDAFAYPYGDYTDDCVKAVEDAGFLCAVTTEYERVYPGDNPLLLPRIRMLEGQSLDSFIGLVE